MFKMFSPVSPRALVSADNEEFFGNVNNKIYHARVHLELQSDTELGSSTATPQMSLFNRLTKLQFWRMDIFICSNQSKFVICIVE